MIEEYDDSEIRERKALERTQQANAKAFLEKFEAESKLLEKTACPYCLPAKKGGPLAGDRWHQSGGVRHWVRVARVTMTAKRGLSVWELDAACGATFQTFVDSAD